MSGIGCRSSLDALVQLAVNAAPPVSGEVLARLAILLPPAAAIERPATKRRRRPAA